MKRVYIKDRGDWDPDYGVKFVFILNYTKMLNKTKALFGDVIFLHRQNYWNYNASYGLEALKSYKDYTPTSKESRDITMSIFNRRN